MFPTTSYGQGELKTFSAKGTTGSHIELRVDLGFHYDPAMSYISSPTFLGLSFLSCFLGRFEMEVKEYT